MRSMTYKDEAIIGGIQAGGPLREQWITRLYKKYLYFIHSARKKHKLSEESLKDAYADAILALSDQVIRGDFLGKSKLSTYLYRIYFNKCVDILRKEATNKSTPQEEWGYIASHEKSALHDLELKDDIQMLLGYFDQLGETCKQILMDWGYWGYNMHEIAERMGFKNNKSVISQKHKCMGKLKKIIQSQREKKE